MTGRPHDWTGFNEGPTASADFGQELLSRELEAWDNMPAVGRERFWLPAANRYPFKTLLALKKIKLGDKPHAKGSLEAKRARISAFLKRPRR